MIHFNVVRKHQGLIASPNHSQILRYVLLPGVPAPHGVPGDHVEEHDAVLVDGGSGGMAVVLGPGFPDGHKLFRVVIRESFVTKDRRGHGELPEARHRMEKQRSFVVNVHGTERYAEYSVGPLKLYTVQLVSGCQGIGIEEVMLNSEGGVLEKVVYHNAVSPDVGQVRHCGAAVVVSDVHSDVDVQRVLFNLLVRQGIFPDEGICVQIEDEYGGRADLLGSFGELRLAGIEDPQSIALVYLNSED